MVNDPGVTQKPSASAGGGYTNQKLSMPEIAWHVKQYWTVPAEISGGKNADVVKAIAVAMAESSGNTNPPSAPHGMYGLYQINMNGSLGTSRRKEFNLPSNDELFIATTNVRVAWGIWHKSGWTPWEAYTNGAYKQYMDDAWEAYKNPKQPGNVQQGKVNTEIPFLDAMKDWVNQGFLRAAGFIGGGALLVIAIVMVSKKGIK